MVVVAAAAAVAVVTNSIHHYEQHKEVNHLFCQFCHWLLTAEVHAQECCLLSGYFGKVRASNVSVT